MANWTNSGGVYQSGMFPDIKWHESGPGSIIQKKVYKCPSKFNESKEMSRGEASKQKKQQQENLVNLVNLENLKNLEAMIGNLVLDSKWK